MISDLSVLFPVTVGEPSGGEGRKNDEEDEEDDDDVRCREEVG